MLKLLQIPSRNQYRTYGEWCDASNAVAEYKRRMSVTYLETLLDRVGNALNFSENAEFPEELLGNNDLDEAQELLREVYAKLLKVKA